MLDDLSDGQAQRNAVLLAELLLRLLFTSLLPMIADGQPPDILLGNFLVVVGLNHSTDRNVAITILDADRDTGFTLQISVLHTTGRRIHDDVVATQLVPHDSLVRQPIRANGSQDGKTLLGE